MTVKYAFVTDFDGTISDDDFFNYIAKQYFDEQALAPWRQYLSGHKTHFDALNEMFGQLKIPADEFNQFISQIAVDKYFSATIDLCFSKNIPIYICSAGCDYYIKLLIGDLIKKYNITLVTNDSHYCPLKGLNMQKPSQDSPYYDEKIGISKASIVARLHQEGYRVIYAGDGPPDIEAAKIADVVFAKKILLSKCQELGISTLKFNNFNDILNFIKEV